MLLRPAGAYSAPISSGFKGSASRRKEGARERKGRKLAEREGAGGEVDSDAQLEQRRQIAGWLRPTEDKLTKDEIKNKMQLALFK